MFSPKSHVQFYIILMLVGLVFAVIIYLTMTSEGGPPPPPGFTMQEVQEEYTSLHSPTTHSEEQNSWCPGL